MPDFSLEIADGAAEGRIVIGLDEAGRGPWAGPVTAAAAWLDPARLPRDLLLRLDDSKRLTPQARDEVYSQLVGEAAAEFEAAVAVAVGWASVAEIDRLNILQASLLAMRRAAAALPLSPAAALVDGKYAPDLPCPARPVVRGDSRSYSIAAASIVAKVTRDRHMQDLAEEHPGYGWERNRGYGTAQHAAALRRLGVTEQHRRSFRPVRETLSLTI